MPDVLGPLVGTFEVLCGTLVLLGLLTRLAVVPLLVIMAVALVTTKWPLLAQEDFWYMAHESRTDWSMTLGALYLLVVGAGAWSIDARLSRRRHVSMASDGLVAPLDSGAAVGNRWLHAVSGVLRLFAQGSVPRRQRTILSSRRRQFTALYARSSACRICDRRLSPGLRNLRTSRASIARVLRNQPQPAGRRSCLLGGKGRTS